ncbi:hypothetical protein F5141DRAFT_1059355 [Pisolithus sp. B1]|nr:hypothetical protein F5141DRAFT_1069042 [Pisolithus sp. B1]KAI6136110.1 hypothetical protein F5141DRAFT_1059355 [Pisolithus sp. B1]
MSVSCDPSYSVQTQPDLSIHLPVIAQPNQSSHHLMSHQCPNFHQPAPPVPNFNQPHKCLPSSNAPPVPNFHQPSMIFNKPSPQCPNSTSPHQSSTSLPHWCLTLTSSPHQCLTSTSPYTSFSPPSHISMARTKQTARKVTGGHAPRVNLEVLQKKKTKAKAASKKAPLKIPAKDNAVIICLDGGDMWICDEEGCHRVRVKKADVKFMCMTCHWQKTKMTPSLTCFSQLSFNLGTPESMDAYDKAASDLANTLSAYSRVVLFLTTHSDEDRGDLFTGYINEKPVAYKVLPFLQLLLKPLSKIVNGADIVFYVCGSVVTNPQSFNGVKEVAQHISSWLPQSPTSKASWTTPSSKAFLFPVQLRLL